MVNKHMNLTLLRNNNDVTSFLQDKADPDEDIVWVCPKCQQENHGLWYSHSSPCECGDFEFPCLVLPLSHSNKDSLLVALTSQRIETINEDILNYKDEISGFEEEITDRENWICELEKERDDLKDILLSDKKRGEN